MKNIYKYALLAIVGVSYISCTDDVTYGENDDINFPASILESFEPKVAYVGEQVTILGEKLDLVERVQIGNVDCEVVSQSEGEIVFNIARLASRDKITIINSYSRENISVDFLSPEYYAAVVTKWPAKLQQGSSFALVGENMDLISEVKVGAKVVPRQGVATETKATFSLKDIVMEGETAVVTVLDKSGVTFKSEEIVITAATTTYVPSKTLLLANFEDVMPEFVDGDSKPYTSTKNGSGVVPMFQDYWTVSSPAGNGWAGIYQKMRFDNGGAGYDLSSYNDPHISFLINTNDISGYFGLALNGSDQHFKGQEGEYSDDYKFVTEGWEWRSYSLTGMGFDVSVAIETFELWFRGGNIGDAVPFDVSVDQVMITDGALVWDMETAPTNYGGDWIENSGTGFTNVAQGETYYTIKKQAQTSWTFLGGISQENIDCSKLTNAIYLNFYVNTGTTAAGGYFQMVFEQGGVEYFGQHFCKNDAYTDDYSIKTSGEWEWRSWYIDPATLEGFDPSSPFTFKANATTGNIGTDKGNSGEYELNLDYVVFTGTPIDNQ